MKKTILIIVALFIVGYANSETFSKASYDDKICEDIKNEITSLMEECKTCKNSVDCFIDDKFTAICPFGCYFVRSHVYDGSQKLKLINVKIDEYSDNCRLCEYKCMLPPTQDEIGCRSGKCVDLRYYEEK